MFDILFSSASLSSRVRFSTPHDLLFSRFSYSFFCTNTHTQRRPYASMILRKIIYRLESQLKVLLMRPIFGDEYFLNKPKFPADREPLNFAKFDWTLYATRLYRIYAHWLSIHCFSMAWPMVSEWQKVFHSILFPLPHSFFLFINKFHGDGPSGADGISALF